MATKKQMPDIDATSQTFQVASSKDMLRKLKWEAGQSQQFIYSKPQGGYSGLNTAVTAWHTLDWIAAELSTAGQWKKAIDALGLELKPTCTTDEGRAKLQKYAMNSSAVMQAAEQLANAYKHRERLARFFDYGVHTPGRSPDVQISITRTIAGGTEIYGMRVPHFAGELVDWIERLMRTLEFPVS